MSALANEYELSQYKELEILDEKKNISIVCDIRNNKIWIKKEIDENGYIAYEKVKNISHPNIAYIYKVLNVGDKYYVIEEYVSGVSIKEYVEEKGVFTPTEVRKIMSQVCDGITCLHKNNIIHRDIKPANVMLAVDGNVKIIDLGISRIRKKAKTQDTTILGTAGYASPEQFGFSQTDITSDIYSCGALMNFMFTGSLPDVNKHKGKMSYIIDICLKMEQNSRFKSAQELKTAINNCYVTKKDLLKLPGFRTHTWWKMIIGFWGYAMFILSVLCVVSASNFKDFFNFLEMSFLIIPFLITTNYLYIQERIPVVKNLSRIKRKLAGILLGALFTVFLLGISGYLDIYVFKPYL